MGSLVADLVRLEREVPDYQGSPKGEVLEHTTRRFVIDRIFQSLGWNLGVEGNMREEARIKTEKVTFMDYVGVVDREDIPVLIIEAKAWGKPFVRAKQAQQLSESHRPRRQQEDAEVRRLLVQAAQHVKAGGGAADSPVTADWHQYLIQGLSYFRGLWDQGHRVEMLVITSGEWMVIFECARATFLEDQEGDPARIWHLFSSQYEVKSDEIYDRLSNDRFNEVIPEMLRPPQLVPYTRKDNISALYHGIVVKYEQSGAFGFAVRPRIQVYPVMLVERSDGIILVASEMIEGFLLQDAKGDIEDHLAQVNTYAVGLLERCKERLQLNVSPAQLESFPGFKDRHASLEVSRHGKLLVKSLAKSHEWLLATGAETHYLVSKHRVRKCGFHHWIACHQLGRAHGEREVLARSIDRPRSFFTDGQTYHCAHEDVIDERDDVCWISSFEERMCCYACIYRDQCWTGDKAKHLPCGG